MGDAAFSPTGAFAILAAALASFLVVGNGVAALGLPVMLAMVTGALMLLVVPVLAMVRTRRRPLALGVRGPAPRFIVASLLIGSSAWYLNMQLLELLPIPEGRLHALQALVDQPPLVIALLAIAVVPALCEEVMFRGVLLRGLATRFAPGAAVALSALVFAIYHLSLVQLIPTFTLGLLLGVLALRAGSAVPAVIAHLCNNALAVVIAREEVPAIAAWLGGHPIASTGLAAALTASGLAVALRRPADHPGRPRLPA